MRVHPIVFAVLVSCAMWIPIFIAVRRIVLSVLP